MADGTVKCKSFVSEAELEACRKKRQEEWEKVRKPDDPLGKQRLDTKICQSDWLAISKLKI